MAKPTANSRKLTDFIPDDKNANRHTERGLSMLEDSLQNYGAGRSILVDKNNKVIAGNATLETAVQAGFEDAIVIPTDGKQLVVVQRVDIDIDSPKGRNLAISDNRSGELNLSWDADVLAGLKDDGVDVARYFKPAEIQAYERISREYAGLEPGVEQGAFPARRGDAPRVFPLSIVLTKQQYDAWAERKAALGAEDDTKAFLKLLDQAGDD